MRADLASMTGYGLLIASRASLLAFAHSGKDIYEFVGVFTNLDDSDEGGTTQEPLGLENTLWADTVRYQVAASRGHSILSLTQSPPPSNPPSSPY